MTENNDRLQGPQEWLSPAELADELKIPVQTVYNWRSRKSGPRGHVIGRHVRFSRADVDAWLESVADEQTEGLRGLRGGTLVLSREDVLAMGGKEAVLKFRESLRNGLEGGK